MIEKSKVDESKILGIGVGVPEPIDFASGNGLRKNAAFVHEVSEQFGLSVLFSDFLEEAAVGQLFVEVEGMDCFLILTLN